MVIYDFQSIWYLLHEEVPLLNLNCINDNDKCFNKHGYIYTPF